MHLDQVQLQNIMPVTFSLSVLEDKLCSNFRIIVEALKSQEAIRQKHEALATQNYFIKEQLQKLKSKVSSVETDLEEKMRKEVLDMQVQGSAIRIEFQTIKPYLEKIKYNTERMDGVEKHFKQTYNVVKEFQLIRKDMLGMEGRTHLMVENYKDQYNRKTARLQEDLQTRQVQAAKLEDTVVGLKQRLEMLNTSISLGITKQQHLDPVPGRPGPSIDDVFKQKVLEKINDINSRLQEVAFQSETTSLRDNIRQLRKVIDNKMDMDQYERMLDFMGEETKRAIAAHEQKQHSQTNRDFSIELPSQQNTARVTAESVPQVEQTEQMEPVQPRKPTEIAEPVESTHTVEEGRFTPPLKPKEQESNLPANESATQQQEDQQTGGEESPSKKKTTPAEQQPAPNSKFTDLKMDKISNNLLPARRRYLSKAPSGSNNKAQVDEIKMLQTINSRIQFLESEVEDLRRANINLMRNLEQQPREIETTMNRNEKTQSMVAMKPNQKLNTSRREGAEPSLPTIHRDAKTKVLSDDSMEMIDRHRRRNSNSNVIFGNNAQRDGSQRPAEDRSVIQKNTKDLEKKLADLRNEVHYYFKQLQKSINVRQTKEDARKKMDQTSDRIEQVRKLTAKKIDGDSVKKSLLFLENKLNQVIAIMIANEGQAEATMARRGWACLSCDKGMEKFDGKQGEHKAWNLIQGHQSPPRGSGFANLQRSQQRYKNLYMDKNPGDE